MAAVRHGRIRRADGRWCVVTRTGIVIGCRAPRAKLRKPSRLPTVPADPLAAARVIVWGCIAILTVWALVLLGYLLVTRP